VNKKLKLVVCFHINTIFLSNATWLNCTVICHKGNDATSIPSQCCAYPYTLNGELYYNCTVNTAFSNDFGCYNDNGQWVTCEQPEGMLSCWVCCWWIT